MGFIDETTKDWQNKVNGAVGGFNNKVESGVDKAIGKMFGNSGSSNIKNDPVREKYHIDPIDFRSKLEVECPDFMKAAGIYKVDFGSVFLSPQAEAGIAQMQNMINTGIAAINGAQQWTSDEILRACQSLITFIITDLIQTVTNYLTEIFLTYTSPSFYTNMAMDVTQKALHVTREHTEDPMKMLERMMKDAGMDYEAEMKKAQEESGKTTMGKINNWIKKAGSDVKKVMDEIEPYYNEACHWIAYGPDYACQEVQALYTKYLDMGMDIVDSYKREVEQLVNSCVDYGATQAGLWGAKVINNTTEKQCKKMIDDAEKGKRFLKLKAYALVNKATMNLLALLGG